jgi:hypothetical protein
MALASLGILGFTWLSLGGMPVAASRSALPGEKFFAHVALKAAIGNFESMRSPIPTDESNLLSG